MDELTDQKQDPETDEEFSPSENGGGTSSGSQDSSDEEDDHKMVEGSAQKLDELRNERDEMEDKYLRKVADLDNFRKRVRQ